MDRYPSFAGQTVLVSDSTPAIGLTAVARALADDEPTWAVRIGQRNRAERPARFRTSHRHLPDAFTRRTPVLRRVEPSRQLQAMQPERSGPLVVG